jgi:glycosyltransferase involved in cell wall biosynthesis
MFISICIPTYEMRGQGVNFLLGSLNAISYQTYNNFEVIISDNSQGPEIEYLCKWHPLSAKIKYHRFSRRYGKFFAHNLENAISLASGDIVKILFQDDRIFLSESLARLAGAFQKYPCNWIASGCVETPDFRLLKRVFFPSWSDDFINGVNTIGSPSVVAFRRGKAVPFDKELIWLVDCDFYYRQRATYGAPGFLMSPDIFIGIGDHQFTNTEVNESIIVKEKNLVRSKAQIAK